MTTSNVAETAEADAEAGRRTTREDWLDLAKDILVSEGVGSIKVLALAQRLGVSRSSFYWFFKSRRDLLDQLLHYWEHKNTASIVERAKRPSHSIVEAVFNLFECWVDEALFDPGLDFAVREWARRSPTVRELVDRADNERVAAITGMFANHGYEEPEAFVRARVIYFMQIGYYALGVREPLDVRLSYSEAYVRSFTGKDPTTTEMNRFRNLAKKLAASANGKKT
ncbi:TetR/AcrR family transcriptional regulator [Hoeflea poritis]|uniref:TetR/AcrR family transcriptional regulator n=1 Tax=Hoeflea poritis TaxID=2993659 RepID=A0ABT4VJ81_9HYPH|nr:TetR/AcrR family transcriptional regulator [Hoeflea poritis]MDA4844774.1 TetR/AcrR family transcriptional regulator [Hoeflea poritis]